MASIFLARWVVVLLAVALQISPAAELTALCARSLAEAVLTAT
jgi:hypothetical protein